MRALTVSAPGVHAVAERPEPVPGPGDAVVASQRVALCGTDFRLFAGGLHDADYPVVPGHEWVGTVVACPSRPELVGVRVVGSNFVVCGRCHLCRRGLHALCVELDELGFTRPGACGERFTIPAANLAPLPAELSPDEGCLLEPLGVALHAVERAEVRPGSRAVVLGGGPLGLLIAQLVAGEAAGAGETVVVEPRPERRALAASLGLTAIDELGEVPFEPSLVIDATGNAQAFPAAVDALAVAGRLVVVGYSGAGRTSFAPASIMLKQLTVTGSLSGYGRLQQAIDAVAGGRVRLEPLVSHHFAFDDYGEAIRTALDPVSGAMRIVLDMPGESDGQGMVP